jgi:hypothetical protein
MQKKIMICILTCLALVVVATAQSQSAGNTGWATAWTAGPQQQVGELTPLINRTVRAYAPLSIGGQQLRVRFSNEYGSKPLTIRAATVGLIGPGGGIQPETLRNVMFGGASSILVPVGAPAYSDPIDLDAPGAATVAISMVYVRIS